MKRQSTLLVLSLLLTTLLPSSVLAAVYSFNWASSYWYRTTSTYSGIGVPVKITGVSGLVNAVTMRVWRDTADNDGVAILRAVDHNGDLLGETAPFNVSEQFPDHVSYPNYPGSGTAGRDMLFSFSAPFEMDSSGTFFYLHVVTNTTYGGNMFYGTTSGGANEVSNQVCYGGNATADIPNCNPYNAESARIVIEFIPPPEALPSLAFPLDCSTPTCSGGGNITYTNGAYTTESMNSVLDHNMAKVYSEDGVIVSFTGETFNATRKYPTTKPQPCYPKENDDDWSILLLDIYKGTTGTGSSNCTAGVALNYDAHPGYDYKAAVGTPVYAAAAGTVVIFRKQKCILKGLPRTCAYWGAVGIDHGNGYITQYLHMSDISVDAGDPVSANELIGHSGDTGVRRNPHLHLEVLKRVPETDGTSVNHYRVVDPYRWTGIGTDPLETATGFQNVCLWQSGCP